MPHSVAESIACRLTVLVSLAVCAGCATHERHLLAVRDSFYAGDLTSAAETFDAALKRGHRDREVLLLERAMVDLAGGNPKACEQALRAVRDRFDYLEQASLGESALAMLTDDTRKSYAGEDHEKVLIRAMLALANLLSDGQDAAAYALQIADQQRQIVQAATETTEADGQNPKLAYKQVALGPYLHGMIREATHANYDDAARASALVVSWQPGFAYGRGDLERARHGRHSAPGHGVLYVFALVGRGPYKQEVLEMPTTVSLLIADRILSATNRYSLPPTIAPVKVPRMVAPPNAIARIGVAIDGQPAGATDTITDVGRMAVEQHAAVYPSILARAVVRRVVKKGVVFGTKEAMGANQATLTSVALDVAGIAWEATEAADTRCWGLLPDKIQVLRLELPAGRHQVGLSPLTAYGLAGAAANQEITISDGRNTYLLANFPDAGLVGRVLVSQP
ncbi:MAG TPA: hypothetical protein VFW87_01765 [Pirellulales bacterium]|nr:hypothetical protein [Pirellulales bacterium]